ncbi:hypothetical protein CUJ83_14295 [Methanocella sp. CWC-04]|uniref:DUF340 domain-containing protein n=1 Tax=Methanooceanicella nereidis TaxID=2052831 RepID=A0AAP2RH89_9EURY|nr:LysO family transporter [Methanocella sp. CWC-04]MCD1296170.1 hypothetical protein [Methanocella sp. CWC-04]
MIDQMLISVGLLIISLIAGILAGLGKGSFSEKEKKWVSKIMTGLVFVLILLMGIKTGMNDMVISNLGSYGLNALLITLGAVAGSILFAFIFDKFIVRSVAK